MNCTLCPRRCGADRAAGETGRCGTAGEILVARAAPHFGEEPCISGSRGSGAVFFCGCALGCVFCQNREISRGGRGRAMTPEALRRTLERLRDAGVHNLELVTAGHYLPILAWEVLTPGLGLPLVWNSGGYEAVEALRLLEGKVDVYMPDLKTLSPALAERWCAAPDYPAVAKAALSEMYRQVGPPVFDQDGLLVRGLLIRHLVMPGAVEDTLDVLDYLEEHFGGGRAVVSLMGQYTPMPGCEGLPELQRPLTQREYDRAAAYLACRDLPLGYTQDISSATTAEIPDFDGTGLGLGGESPELREERP